MAPDFKLKEYVRDVNIAPSDDYGRQPIPF